MAGDWENLTLGDLGRVVTGKTPLTSVEGNFGGRIPFVTPSDMDGRKSISTTARFLTQAGAVSVKGSVIPAGAIMVSCIGSDMGKVVVAGCECVTNQQINSIVVDDRFSCEFVYYSLSTRKDEIRHQAAGGSAVPILNKGNFSRMEITLPPLAEQKRIAEVLGVLDDKIELNRRMNAALEATVRALFQSWFVDFDPVRAKLDGRHPSGMDAATAALFSDSFEESPLGKIPHGWRAKQFIDVLTTRTERVGTATLPEFSASIDGLSSRDDRFKKQLSKSQEKNKRIVKGDLVFGFSREAINFGLMRETEGAVSPVYEVFKVESAKIDPDLLERLFRFNMFYYMDILKPGAREGKPIDRNYLLQKHLLVPDIAVQQAFLQTIQPWVDKIKTNAAESRTLVTLRDTLLPKLLSGEISVS